jgi:hypothetical protein
MYVCSAYSIYVGDEYLYVYVYVDMYARMHTFVDEYVNQ